MNSLAPGKFQWKFKHIIFKRILVIDGWGISNEIAPNMNVTGLNWRSVNIGSGNGLLPQFLSFPTARWPRASKTTSRASGFEQIFPLFHISRSKNFKILEVGQVMILRKGKSCAVRQQAIAWTNVDPDLCRHMVSPVHNELTHFNEIWIKIQICSFRKLYLKMSSKHQLCFSYLNMLTGLT